MSGDLIELYQRVQRAADELASRFKSFDEWLDQVQASLARLPGATFTAPPGDKRADARLDIGRLPADVRRLGPACQAAISLREAADAWSQIESDQAADFIDRFEVTAMAKNHRGWAGPGADAYSAFVRDNHQVATALDSTLKKAVRKLRECDETTNSWLFESLTQILGVVLSAASALTTAWKLLGVVVKMCAEVIALFETGNIVVGSAAAASALATIQTVWMEVVSAAILTFIALASLALVIVNVKKYLKKMIEDAGASLTDISNDIKDGQPWRKPSTLPATGHW